MLCCVLLHCNWSRTIINRAALSTPVCKIMTIHNGLESAMKTMKFKKRTSYQLTTYSFLFRSYLKWK